MEWALKEHDKGLIPLVEENGIYNFYLELEEKEEVAEMVDVAMLESSSPEAASSAEDPVPAASGLGARPKAMAKEEERDEEEEDDIPPWRKEYGWKKKSETVWALEDEAPVRPGGGGAGEAVEESVEARAVNPGWSPANPSARERKEHEATGHGIKARGVVQVHRKVDHGEDRLPTVCLDYFYMSEEEGAKPNLVAVDRDTGMVMATAINQKGVVDLTAQKALTRFLEILGYREVVLKSDGERSLLKMKMEAAKQARGVSRAAPEESPQGDARANGQAEVAVKEVKWRIRAILLTLAKKFEGGVPQGHPLTYWAPSYAAQQINRFKVGEDGRTPDERRTGKKWVKPMPLFGEKILVKPAGKGRRGDLEKMKAGRYLGTHNTFGSVLAMTDQGVIVGTGHHALPAEEKWGKVEEGMRGVPWDVKKYVELEPQPKPQQEQLPAPPVVIIGGSPGPGGEVRAARAEDPESRPAAAGEEAPAPGTPGRGKAWPVRREMLNKYGKTPGCGGCISIIGGTQQVGHSEECRLRILKRIKDDDEADQEKRRKQRLEDEAEEKRSHRRGPHLRRQEMSGDSPRHWRSLVRVETGRPRQRGRADPWTSRICSRR